MTTMTHSKPEAAVDTDTVGAEAILGRIAELYSEPQWLTQHRRRAFDVYAATPVPDRVLHLWRYTDPAVFETADAMPPAAPDFTGTREFPAVLKDTLARDALAAAVYVREGLVWKLAVDAEYADAGVVVMDLHEAATQKGDLVRQHLGSLVGADFGRFEALANAAWAGGLLIHVPRGVHVTRPMHIMTAQPREATYLSGRLLVVLEEDAELTLIDEYGEGPGVDGRKCHASSIVELVVGRGARMHYSPVQNWDRGTCFFLTQRARLDRDASLETVLTSVGSGLAKVNSGAILAAAGATSNLFGLAIGDADQHFDHHTIHHHASDHTQSDLKFKTALRDRAHSVYTGLIRIDENAAYCEAYQENRNLLLSPHAKAETIPELEILNNEVRCSHGATVGRIDDEEIFYCESRGIERAEAIRLIVAGFVGPILDRLPEVARDRLRAVVVRRLEAN